MQSRVEILEPSRFQSPFHLNQVVEVATAHPFYSPSHEYPLTPDKVNQIMLRESPSTDVVSLLSRFAITQKQDLGYDVIRRLMTDDNSRNTYRDGAYISVTGGGGGASASMAFLTDVRENRAQRQACGELMGRLGLLTSKDCVLCVHPSGNLYRALDLTIDIVEYAGGSILPAGHLVKLEDLLAMCKKYRPNVIAGDTSQIINFASFIESSWQRGRFNINKVMYTSETMSQFQRSYIESTLGRDSEPFIFTSVFASAESGPWAVSNPNLTGSQTEDSTDFIFDSRHMLVECLPLDFDTTTTNQQCPCYLEQANPGLLCVTSLQRLRNPLVRYLTGDIASIHPLSNSARTKIKGDASHLRILRLYGRNNQQSFSWEGEYFEFSEVKKAMSNPSWGLLKWQIVLGYDNIISTSESLEVRVMRGRDKEGSYERMSEEQVVEELRAFFYVHASNERFFYVKWATAGDFERSVTGQKVLMFIDLRKIQT